MQRIRKAVIPAAGFGTRFLPATKAQPKEMLPIVNFFKLQMDGVGHIGFRNKSIFPYYTLVQTGIPTTRGGLERKVGKMVINALFGKKK